MQTPSIVMSQACVAGVIATMDVQPQRIALERPNDSSELWMRVAPKLAYDGIAQAGLNRSELLRTSGTPVTRVGLTDPLRASIDASGMHHGDGGRRCYVEITMGGAMLLRAHGMVGGVTLSRAAPAVASLVVERLAAGMRGNPVFAASAGAEVGSAQGLHSDSLSAAAAVARVAFGQTRVLTLRPGATEIVVGADPAPKAGSEVRIASARRALAVISDQVGMHSARRAAALSR